MTTPPSAPSVSEAAELPLFSWLEGRGAGILLHPTCFPGEQGVGTFDEAVDDFLAFLQRSGLTYWQLCPLGPTGYGDSPYQCFSAFAGNPYLIDLQALVRYGLLTAQDLAPLRDLDHDRVDFGGLYHYKWPLLRKAHASFRERKPVLPYGSFEAFQSEQASWLEPYAYFRALKDHFQGKPWWEWPVETRHFTSARSSALRQTLEREIEAHAFYQYLFFGQWARIRSVAAHHGIQIIGDLPIFVALDSADVWANPELFELDPTTSQPLAVAGVPPDYFSEDGQLWGNPLYQWDVHARDGYAWWIQRLRASFELYDVVRIDHFRGFDQYWRIPFPAKTAKVGAWTDAPGLKLFRVIKAAFPDARIIAEDLGELTDSVVALREQTGLPGMAILQFAFGSDTDSLYLPHNHTANSAVYPGTHDNNTTLGWYATASEKERDHVRRYLNISGQEIGWDFIRAAYRSVSRLAIFPLQDLLSLGADARINTPGEAQGNWQWRYRAPQLDQHKEGTADYLRSLGKLYAR